MRLTGGNPYLAGGALLAAALIAVVLATGINVSFGLPFGLAPDYTLGATFADAGGLVKGARVEIGGVEIGQVTGVSVEGRRALVEMRIGGRYAPLYRGTVARIRYSTLLAEKFVELTPAQGTPALAGGSVIPSDETITPVDFDQFLSSLDPPTRQAVRVVVRQLGGGVSGRRAAINGLLDELAGLTEDSTPALGTLSARDPQLASITDDLAVAAGRLAESHQQLGDLVGRTAVVTGTLEGRAPQLDSLIVHLARVAEDTDETLDGNEGNLNQAVTQLDPLLVSLDDQVVNTNPLLLEASPELERGFDRLTPEIVSAIASQDANGNYLRQFVVMDLCYDTRTKTVANPRGGCLVQAVTGAVNPDTTSGNGVQPNPTSFKPGENASPSPCPSPSPSAAPAPSPSPSATPCPTPTPCAPAPSPSPSPSPSPTCSGSGGSGGGLLDPIKGLLGGLLGG